MNCPRYYGRYNFDYKNITDTTNIKLKWMSICFNIDFKNGSMEAAMNGEILTPIKKKPLEMATEYDGKDLILHMGRYQNTVPIIGKMADINVWDR